MPGGIGSIIDNIIGSDDVTLENSGRSNNTQTGTVRDVGSSETNTNSSTQTGSVTESTQSQATNQRSTSRLLDDAQIASLNSVLDKLSGEFSLVDMDALQAKIGGANDTLVSGAKDALSRAFGGDATLANTIDPIINAARLKTQRDVSAVGAKTAAGAGSSFNTLVQQTQSGAIADGEINIAALGADLNMKARAQVSNEILQALTALQGASQTLASTGTAAPLAAATIDATRAGAVANLGNTLKGAVSSNTLDSLTTTNGRQETQQTVNSTVQSIVDNDSTKTVDLNSITDTIGTSNRSDDTGILDILNSLLS